MTQYIYIVPNVLNDYFHLAQPSISITIAGLTKYMPIFYDYHDALEKFPNEAIVSVVWEKQNNG